MIKVGGNQLRPDDKITTVKYNEVRCNGGTVPSRHKQNTEYRREVRIDPHHRQVKASRKSAETSYVPTIKYKQYHTKQIKKEQQ